MAVERVFLTATTDTAVARVIITSRSTVRLEWAAGAAAGRREFQTLEEMFEFVAVQPFEFDAALYDALLRGLEQRGGGSL